MDAKLFSRPMAAILNRLKRYDDVAVVPFGNRCIFEKPVEAWPIVNFLICFYSAGFPLAKAEEYVRLRNPICINDVLSQHVLLNRTAVYAKLRASDIPVPVFEVFHPRGDRHDAVDFR
jgi:inositol hexakisphosphate/diphosphoinositol-pentakisphosphate kinase